MWRRLFILFIIFFIVSCSTTKVLQDGEYRLAGNNINIKNSKEFNASQISPYLKQQPNTYFLLGWNPFLNIYNWSNGKEGRWDKFVHKLGVPPVVYDSTLVAESIDNMEKHLEYLGYYNSTVESVVSVRKKRIKVDYNVTLGNQYRIRSIEYDLPKGVIGADLIADSLNFTVKVGDQLSEKSLEEETSRLASYLRDKAYFNFSKNYFSYEADTLEHPREAKLNMYLRGYTRNENESQSQVHRKFYINDVKIAYPANLKLRHKVVKGLNTIIPGELYSEKQINNTYSRLSSLQLFSGVNIEMQQVDTNLVDCNINLSQSKLQGFKVNLEASSNSTGLLGISPQLSYYHKNIFNGGEWLNLSFMGNFQFKVNDDIRSNEFGVSAGLSFPKFVFLPYRVFKGATIPRTDVNVSYNYQSRPEYTRNIISTKYGYTGNLKSKFYFQVYPVQLSIIRLENLDPYFYDKLENDPYMQNAYQDHFDLGLGSTLYYTTSSETNPKSSVFYSRLQFDISGNILSAFKPLMARDENNRGVIWNTPYSQYVRAELALGKTWRFGANNGQAVATRLQIGAGYAYGNSSALPFEKHFYGGGANSMRGWQTRTLGPGMSSRDTSFVIPNQTGDMKLELNVEYRFKMFWKVEGAAFVDAGNIWTINELNDSWEGGDPSFTFDNFGESIAMNWGLGVRVDLDFLVLRVDWGLKLHDPARAEQTWLNPRDWFKFNGNAVHFGVGYPF